jgi:hypothetical protein
VGSSGADGALPRADVAIEPAADAGDVEAHVEVAIEQASITPGRDPVSTSSGQRPIRLARSFCRCCAGSPTSGPPKSSPVSTLSGDNLVSCSLPSDLQTTLIQYRLPSTHTPAAPVVLPEPLVQRASQLATVSRDDTYTLQSIELAPQPVADADRIDRVINTGTEMLARPDIGDEVDDTAPDSIQSSEHSTPMAEDAGSDAECDRLPWQQAAIERISRNPVVISSSDDDDDGMNASAVTKAPKCAALAIVAVADGALQTTQPQVTASCDVGLESALELPWRPATPTGDSSDVAVLPWRRQLRNASSNLEFVSPPSVTADEGVPPTTGLHEVAEAVPPPFTTLIEQQQGPPDTDGATTDASKADVRPAHAYPMELDLVAEQTSNYDSLSDEVAAPTWQAAGAELLAASITAYNGDSVPSRVSPTIFAVVASTAPVTSYFENHRSARERQLLAHSQASSNGVAMVMSRGDVVVLFYVKRTLSGQTRGRCVHGWITVREICGKTFLRAIGDASADQSTYIDSARKALELVR